ncbi:MAG: discoidin domain-containing protein [Elusimicrobia bacterium]|nr:discoidin domain-containing protein [Elusimicrobiota bacterium]
MRNWIVLGMVFGMCLTCTGQVEAKKKDISKKATTPKKSETVNKKKVSVPNIKIEAEDFDKGGEGVGYHDIEANNRGGQYRTDEGVDIENCSEGGYNVGYVLAGEWLKYTINIKTAGTYTIEVRVACGGNGGSFHIEIDDVDKTGPLTVPDTGGWQTWQTLIKKGVSLSAGQHIMKLAMDTIGTEATGNFNYINLKYESEQSDAATEEKPTKNVAKKLTDISGNIAKGKPVVASSIEAGYGNEASNAVDGNMSTRWSSTYSDPQWVQVDLGTTYNITKVVLKWEEAYGKDYEIQVSNSSNGIWQTIYTKTGGTGGTEDIPSLSGNGRYVRMYGTSRKTNYGYSLYEFEIYGQVEPLTPIITVTSPNGNEIWRPANSDQTVKWTSAGITGNVNIDISTDGGTTWTSLVSNTPNDGSHLVKTPNTPSTTCRIRVQKSDGSPTDTSNNNFTISTFTPVRIMPLGDSITAFNPNYRTHLWTLLNPDTDHPNLDFVGSVTDNNCPDPNHEGHGGYTIGGLGNPPEHNGLYNNIDAWLTLNQPDIILLHIGTNDVGSFTGDLLANTPDRLSALIDKITTKLPDIKIYVVSIIPIASYGAKTVTELHNDVTKYNNAIPSVVAAKQKQGKKVYFVDMNTEANIIPATDLRDGCHVSQSGADKMADVWYSHLTRPPSKK